MIHLVLPMPPSVNRFQKNVTRTRKDGSLYRGRADSSETKLYRRHFALVISQAELPAEPYRGLICIQGTWYFENERSDRSNYDKVLFDCLQGRAYMNDVQIVEEHKYKRFDPSNPRVELEISEVEVDE